MFHSAGRRRASVSTNMEPKVRPLPAAEDQSEPLPASRAPDDKSERCSPPLLRLVSGLASNALPATLAAPPLPRNSGLSPPSTSPPPSAADTLPALGAAGELAAARRRRATSSAAPASSATPAAAPTAMPAMAPAERPPPPLLASSEGLPAGSMSR